MEEPAIDIHDEQVAAMTSV